MYQKDTVEEILDYFKEMTERNYSRYTIETDLKRILETYAESEYQRGFADGYSEGYDEGKENVSDE